MSFFKKPFMYAITFVVCLSLLTTFLLLDVYTIPTKMGEVVEEEQEKTEEEIKDENTSIITDTSYITKNIKINITTSEKYDSKIYTADVVISDAKYLKTALAQNSFGLNIKEKTSVMAQNKEAVFAVNGDYYGANKSGYVIKNGVAYRSTTRSSASTKTDLVIYENGDFGIINETKITTEELLAQKVMQLFAFGPPLIENSQIAVDEDDEVSVSSSKGNPRTAIGIISPLHYVFVTSDGRTAESPGLSLYELATVMQENLCVTAYNLDGGGSATMWFNGKVVNKPTADGKTIVEREVSDCVYIGF